MSAVLARLTGSSWKEVLLAAWTFAYPVFAVVVSFPWFGVWPSPRRINVRQITTRRGGGLTGVLIVMILLTALASIFSGFVSRPVHADTASRVVTALAFTGICTSAGALDAWSPQRLPVSVACSLAFAAPATSVRYLAPLLCTRRDLPWRLRAQFRHREL
ncbi:hypothetical protein [Streptomyces decoyicus]